MHNYRLPALAPDSRPQKHEKRYRAFLLVFFWVDTRGASGLYLYGPFLICIFANLKNNLLYPFSHRPRVSVANAELTANVHASGFGLIAVFLATRYLRIH
jgi:hypothetical protein